MKTSELFESLDRPWNLVTDNDATNEIKNIILGNGHGNGGLKVYHKENDPTHILFIIYHNGAWEVHHVYDLGEITISGERFQSKYYGGRGGDKPNTGFPATALKLYQELLDIGHSIRVTAAKTPTVINPITNKPQKTLWDAYEKFIKHVVSRSNGKYMAGPINYNGVGIQGKPGISQIVRPYGKKWIEEALNKRVR